MFRFQSRFSQRAFGTLGDSGMITQDFFHVPVLIPEAQLRTLFSVFLVEVFHRLLHGYLSRFKSRGVVVPDNIGKIRLLHAPLEGNDVEETFIALGVLRTLVHGKE